MSCSSTIRALVCVALAGCGGGQAAVRPDSGPPGPDQLYPLAVGNAWSYDVDAGEGDTVLAVARVVSVRGAAVEVLSGGGEVLRYERRTDGIYRPHKSGYLLKAPVRAGQTWQSANGVTAEVSRIVDVLETPAGRFEGCVEVHESGLRGGQHVETTYCPGVGPTRVVSRMDVRGRSLRVVAELRGYAVGPPAAE